jgi:hypothetical protein
VPGALNNVSTLDTCVIAYDQIFDSTSNAVAVVTSITDATHLNYALVSGTISNGDTFTIYKGLQYPGYNYGTDAHFGLNDIHAPMNYFNQGNYFCDWYNQVTGASEPCNNQATTAITDISRKMVEINGWDYGSGSSLAGTNCTSNCPQRVTPNANLTVMKALAAMRLWYTPYNGMYSNTDCRATPCQWTGAVQGYPAAILSSN